jgi:hypothetical protein
MPPTQARHRVCLSMSTRTKVFDEKDRHLVVGESLPPDIRAPRDSRYQSCGVKILERRLSVPPWPRQRILSEGVLDIL